MKALRPIASCVLACLIAVLVILLALLPATSYTATDVGSKRYSQIETPPLGETEKTQVVAMVWGFVVKGSPTVLPDVVDGYEAFDDDAISHLEDVRVVLQVVRGLLVGVLVLVAAGIWLYLRQFSRRSFGLVCIVTAASLVGILIVLALWATIDFRSFFEVFHRLFFSVGTYSFAPSSLLIQCFPEQFWVFMGSVWLGGIVLISLALAVFGYLLRRRDLQLTDTIPV